MKKDKTDITVILDRSGSMSTIAKDMEGGLNTFFNAQKELTGECTASLVQFDDHYDIIFKNIPVKDVPVVQLVPRGWTALYDAIGKTISAKGVELAALPESERPEKVIVVIITDGQENSSKEYNSKMVNDMITLQQDTYKWEFVFLGANQDAIKTATNLGINVNNAMTYAASSKGVGVSLSSLTRNVSAYASGATKGASFSVSDRKTQDDLLNKEKTNLPLMDLGNTDTNFNTALNDFNKKMGIN